MNQQSSIKKQRKGTTKQSYTEYTFKCDIIVLCSHQYYPSALIHIISNVLVYNCCTLLKPKMSNSLTNCNTDSFLTAFFANILETLFHMHNKY